MPAAPAGAAHAPVPEEGLAVADAGQERFAHQLRNLIVSDGHPALLADLADQRATAGVHAQRHLQRQSVHAGRARERRGEVNVAGQEGIDDAQQQHGTHDN